MSKINRVPRGLQDLLGSSNQGENPAESLREVRPTFDMFPFWASERLRVKNTGSFNPGKAAPLFFTVPTNELWFVQSISSTTDNNTAGATMQIAFQHRLQNVQDDTVPGTNITPVGQSDVFIFTGSTTTSVLGYTQYFDRPLVVPPDTIISSLITFLENSNAAAFWQLNLVYWRFNV